MEEQEIAEVLELLRSCGYVAEVCDTPVRFYDCGVRAGVPSPPGDYGGEVVMLPKSFCRDAIYRITVRGDSMIDAGLEPDDVLTVRSADHCRDGEVIVASLNGEVTVKMFLTDEEGGMWLVPKNEAYMPIEISKDDDFRVIGIVTDVTKPLRVSVQESVRMLKRLVQRKDKRQLSEARIRRAIFSVKDKITTNRMWYSVFRVLVDRGVYQAEETGRFASDVCDMFPDEEMNIDAKDLLRMAVQSFRKPVALWEADDAPVTGKRFRDYLSLARDFSKSL